MPISFLLINKDIILIKEMLRAPQKLPFTTISEKESFIGKALRLDSQTVGSLTSLKTSNVLEREITLL
jgi:hypothetical protein